MENTNQYNELRDLVTYVESCLIEYEKLSTKLIEVRVQRDLHAAQKQPATDQVEELIELEELVEKQLSLVLYTALGKVHEFKKGG